MVSKTRFFVVENSREIIHPHYLFPFTNFPSFKKVAPGGCLNLFGCAAGVLRARMLGPCVSLEKIGMRHRSAFYMGLGPMWNGKPRATSWSSRENDPDGRRSGEH